MNSGKLLGIIACIFFGLSASSAIALDYQDPNIPNRLIIGDAEEVPAVPLEPLEMPTNGNLPGPVDSYNYSTGDGVGNMDGSQACCCCPRWTAAADFIILDRVGAKSRTLVWRSPVRQQGDLTEALNSNDFHQGFSGGPRVSLIRHGSGCYDFELLYFQIDGWSNTRRVEPDNEWLVFTIPGPLTYDTQDPIQFTYSSKLYNGEFNVRWNPLCRVTMLAGYRWIELRENLDGGAITPTLEPFWNTNTKNNLYGFQIGTDAILWERCRLSIDALAKVGCYGNHAEQMSTAIGTYSTTSGYYSTNHTAFVGELGLQAKYQATKYLTLRAGYELLWLEGVALAPAQIDKTNMLEQQTGIDAKGGVFYHGATVGFEYNF